MSAICFLISCILKPCQIEEGTMLEPDTGDDSGGSNLVTHTFCTLILNFLLLVSDTWYPKLKMPVPLEIQGLQAKNDPT